MPVAVVQVREVSVAVGQRLVAVRVGMGFPGRICGAVRVLVMLIVDVTMLVLHLLVGMGVDVLLAQMQV